MADLITAPQLTALVSQLSTLLAISKDEAEQIIRNAILTHAFAFVVPFSPDTQYLSVKTSATGGTAIGQPSVSTSQTLINQRDATSRSYTSGTEITALTYTVTAGKTLFITDIFVAPGSTANISGRVHFTVYDGTTLIYAAMAQTAGTSPVVGSNNVHSFKTPIKVAAGQVVTIKIIQGDVTATDIFMTGFNGFEE